MTRSPRSRRVTRLALALLALAPVALAGPATAQSDEPTSPPLLACGPGADPSLDALCLGMATPIEPDDSMLDPQPVAWDRIEVAADGRTLTVYFWMGVQDCNGLHSVEVTPADGGIELTVLAGIPEDAATRICIELAQLYSTVVTLDEPLIVSTAS
jgi:hypothetical protein